VRRSMSLGGSRYVLRTHLSGELSAVWSAEWLASGDMRNSVSTVCVSCVIVKELSLVHRVTHSPLVSHSALTVEERKVVRMLNYGAEAVFQRNLES